MKTVTLPTKSYNGVLTNEEVLENYNQLNIDVFCASTIINGEELLQANIPENWELRYEDTGFWVYIHDEHGNRRVSFFYRAGYNKMEAHVMFDTRYEINSIGSMCDENSRLAVIDTQESQKVTGKVTVFESESLDDLADMRIQCVEWLAENKPDWENLDSYWGKN